MTGGYISDRLLGFVRENKGHWEKGRDWQKCDNLFTKDGKWGWWFPCVEEDKSFYHYYNAPAFDKIYILPE